MELTERTVSSQTIFQGRIIRVDMDQVELPDGKTGGPGGRLPIRAGWLSWHWTGTTA